MYCLHSDSQSLNHESRLNCDFKVIIFDRLASWLPPKSAQFLQSDFYRPRLIYFIIFVTFRKDLK